MSLYSPSSRPSNNLNGVGDMNDGSGTINPAALTGNVSHGQPIENSSRGLKRSRSPDQYQGYVQDDDNDDSKPRKRGRPSKTPRSSGDFTSDQLSLPTPASQTSPNMAQAIHPTASAHAVQAAAAPVQASPPAKTTPAKTTTLKALPTVRDHTSDQLNPEGDEYIPREYDEAGEGKVDANGYLQGGREYKIKTFILPGRAEKLFMLATECARTLQYRDSYLLFNKNRSLHKIIAQPKEKEELVARDILPYSYRSRQIAIVTARSMFRQFGSRVIKDGRRVRDDYWEAKARKQGFTEEDAAGEKRPGAARAREEAMQAQASRQVHAYGDIVYSNGPAFGAAQPPSLPSGLAVTMGSMPLSEAYDTAKYRDINRPRQDLTGPAYSDLTRPTTDVELAGQTGHAAEYSKNINAQGQYRRNIVEEYWNRPHDPPVSTPQSQAAEPATSSQPYSSPRFAGTDLLSQQSQAQPAQNSMNPPAYANQQNPMQSPVRQNYPRDTSQFTPQHAQFNRSSSNLSISQTASQPSMPYGAGAFSPMNAQHQQHAWGQPPPQPHQSPGLQRMPTPQFSPSMSQNQIPSPMTATGGHPSHSPHPQQMHQPQMGMLPGQNQGAIGSQQLFGPGAGLQAMNAAGFPGMNMPARSGMYGMPNQGAAPGSYMQPSQGQSQQPGAQNWSGSTGAPSQSGQNWPGY